KALKVNPKAHFGREKYQLHLGRYVLQRMIRDSLKLPLMRGKKTGFYDYLMRIEFNNKDYKSAAHFSELSDAIKGVSGMMTFANHRSPLLLEALGDLLLHTNSVRGAGHLASRAYLKASFETDGATSKAYYEKSKWARELNYYPDDGRIYSKEELAMKAKFNPEKLDTITGAITEVPVVSMDNLVIALKLEVQSAENWYDSLRKDEIAWIKEGKNPDDEFAVKYYNVEKKELRQKVMEYSKTEENNSLWLQLQLSRPQNIMNIHGFNKLDDSTRKMIDSIYAIEFAEENKAEEKTGFPKNENTNATQSGTAFWIWSLLLIPVLGVILYFKMRKRKN
ncbi:MAG: PLD nuclease N-terminal domain-containing protein, partial [Flavobacteriales bacterium]